MTRRKNENFAQEIIPTKQILPPEAAPWTLRRYCVQMAVVVVGLASQTDIQIEIFFIVHAKKNAVL